MNDRARPPRRPPATDVTLPGALPPGDAPGDVPPAGTPAHAVPADGDLADWLGRALLADPGAAAWRDVAFVDWLAAEARAADRPSRRQGDAAFLARGRALQARAHARQLGVLRFPSPPEDAVGPNGASPAAPRRVREGRAGAGSAAAATPWRRRVPVVELGVAAGPGRDLWDEPPERWIALPDFVPDARYLALRVVGTSMTPLLASGDVVLVRADARGREARAGRVVVARHPDDGYVCKRVERAGARELVLASLEPGHGTLHLPADPALVVGTVVAAWPGR